MDTSKTYIKMCEKAEKIQHLWNPTDGDFCWHDEGGEEYLGNVEFPAMTAVVHIATGNAKSYWYNWLWLPRQDQLQEMVGGLEKGFIDFPHWLESIYGWKQDKPNAHLNIFKTWEQLWLAFVMHERFNKVWDGNGWNES